MFLTDISLRPVFAFVVIIAFIALGITSYMGLGLNDMPEADMPVIAVNVSLPGASPDQVESNVTKKIEEAVGQISGVKHITSSIYEDSSLITIEFDDKKPVDVAAQDVRTKIDGIRGTLPHDIEEPVILKFDTTSAPILTLGVTGDLWARDMSKLIINTIIPQLNTVNGVGSVNAYGLQEREIQIKLDKEKLSALNLTSDQVINSLRSDNIDNPSEKIIGASSEITLRTYSAMKNADDFNNILLVNRNGTEIRLRDAAEVVDSIKDRDSLSYYNGKACVGIEIVNQSGTNTVNVADSVKEKIENIQKNLPPGVEISIINDSSKSIRESVHNVQSTLIEGCLLAVFVVFLFLQGLGSTVISAIALPVSIITTFAALKFMGFTLNTMSLMGLSLSVGILIDDSIVVIENIVRHLRMGKSPLQAAREATNEIGLAVMATTFTIVAVFVPLSMMSGIMGAFFKEFGLTIAFSVLVSLFVSFTLAPVLASRYLRNEINRTKNGPVGKFLAWFNHLFDLLADYYRNLLGMVLVKRKMVLVITLILFVLSLSLTTQMEVRFEPPQDLGEITIIAGLDSGLTLNTAEQTAKNLEKIARKYPEVSGLYTTIQPDHVKLNVALVGKEDREDSVDLIQQKMRKEMEVIPGLDLSIIGSVGFSGNNKNYALHIQGDDFDQLLAYSQKAKQLLNQIPGAVDVGLSYKAGEPEARMVVDRDAASDLGVSTTSIADTLSILFNGVVVGQYKAGDDRYDVRVQLRDDQRQDLNSLKGISVTSSTSGQEIPLDQLTKKVYTTSSSSIGRYDKSREIIVQANFVGLTSDELNTAFIDKLTNELPPPEGIRFSMGNEEAQMQDSMGSLIQMAFLSILFTFLILAAQFESFLDPLVIMFSLPLAIIGAAVALFISGSGISLLGSIGIIFLLGLVTKNAILLVDFIKTGREAGMDRKEAILNAGSIRLRPIMMTTLAMIGGMLPSALALGVGSEMRQPMAIAIIGGLVSSTLLTLVIIPVVYTIFDDFKGLFKKNKVRKVMAQRPL